MQKLCTVHLWFFGVVTPAPQNGIISHWSLVHAKDFRGMHPHLMRATINSLFRIVFQTCDVTDVDDASVVLGVVTPATLSSIMEAGSSLPLS